MTGKGGRVRRTRRTNTHDEDQETLATKHHDDTIDQSDDNKSTMSNDTDKLDTSSTSITTKEETNGHEVEAEDTSSSSPTKLKDNLDIVDDVPVINEPQTTEKTNGQSDDKPAEPIKNGGGTDEQSSGEVESINIDSEDPELQFTSEQNSDKSSEVELSPTLNRCRTRRSHTRNLPTPKTPKVPDLNGDLAEEETPKEETPEVVTITITEDAEENSENVSLASNISIDGSFVGEKTLDVDLANASIFVNLGNDTTKNFDLTVQSSNFEMEEEDGGPSNFLETTKDKSYGETLRCLTGRKTSRNYVVPPRQYSSTIDLTDSSRKYVPSVGVKRKLDAESPSDKRMRTEDVSPGILSYLTSPFKNKIIGGRNNSNSEVVQSSTPKLTSFKYVHHGSSVIDEVTKNDLDLGEDKTSLEPRKWCSIM